MTSSPLLAVLTTAPTIDGLASTLHSLQAQGDPGWQWCIGVPADAPPWTLGAVKELIAGESRAVAVPGSADPGELAVLALDLARAQSVCWVEPGDRLDADTVRVARVRLSQSPWLYTDEAAIDPLGGADDIWYKPDYSPERLRSQPYALLLAVLPLDVVREVGGFRPEFGTAVWYDLVLRIAARLGPPGHLAGPFYLHHDAGDGAPFIAGDPFDRCRAVSRAMTEAGEPAKVSPIDVAGRPIGQRVQRQLTRHPKVSLIIPTRASSSIIHGFPRCHAVEFIRSIWTADRYPELEIVVVYDLATPAAALREIEQITGGDVVLTPFHGPFHFSRKCNAGAVVATGEYLCFLNDDMEVVSPDWLHELVGLLHDPGVGAVGARLLFADGTLQHAGHEYNGGYAGHTMFRFAVDDDGDGGAALVTSERSGVTGACMLMRATDFLTVGGFSEEFPLSYNDVDLSLKIRALGLRILYTPHATLFHYESQTREPHVSEAEKVRIRRRWAVQLESDPYVNELRRVSFDGPAPVFD